MKALALLILAMVFILPLSAQFGINGKYLVPSDNWQLVPSSGGQEETSDLFDKGWTVGLDYWFRLKNKRVEFLPELNYTQLNNSLAAYSDNTAGIYSFYFNTNIYFLDFSGDCDCPVWSKEGPTLQKGLFLQISPGVSYWDMQVGSGDLNRYADRHLAFSIGGGIGFDLGLSDLITITPILNVRYFSGITLENYEVLHTQLGGFVSSPTANPVFWSGGLRLGIRLDD